MNKFIILLVILAMVGVLYLRDLRLKKLSRKPDSKLVGDVINSLKKKKVTSIKSKDKMEVSTDKHFILLERVQHERVNLFIDSNKVEISSHDSSLLDKTMTEYYNTLSLTDVE